MSLQLKYFLMFVFVFVKFSLSQNEICIHMVDCPKIYDLLREPNGQAEVEKILCKNDKRYPKVWCSVPCGNSTGYCSPQQDCTTLTTTVETCQLKSTSRYVCCPSQTSPIIESTSETTTSSTTSTPIIENITETITSSTESTATPTKPTQPPNIDNRITEEDECGIQSEQNKIVGGTIADFTDHPWMALLQYKEKGQLVTSCGGVIINKKFVLTAAHCVDQQVNRNIELVNVILGEYNLSTPVDCFRNYCIPKPETIGIKRIIVHPAWLSAERKFFDDIALIELIREVKYTEFIRPICLTRQVIPDSSGEQLTVAGWGRTETSKQSEVKRIAVIQMQQRAVCLNTISKPLRESQLCVGGSNKDSCNGDSGGPLMALDYSTTLPTWRLVGIVSFGRGKCGDDGKPGIYTNVPYYIDWIKENIN